MLGKGLMVDSLVLPVSFDGGIDIEFKQSAPVTVTLVMDGENVERVHADEGIEFQSDSGIMTVEFKPCAEITFLHSKREWRKMLANKQED